MVLSENIEIPKGIIDDGVIKYNIKYPDGLEYKEVKITFFIENQKIYIISPIFLSY